MPRTYLYGIEYRSGSYGRTTPEAIAEDVIEERAKKLASRVLLPDRLFFFMHSEDGSATVIREARVR